MKLPSTSQAPSPPVGSNIPALAERVRQIKESAPLLINQRAAELRESGRDVISLSAGEPDFDTPESAAAAAVAAIRAGRTKYTACAGIKPLRQAIADKMRQQTGQSYSADEILVSNGAKQCIYNAFVALLDPGNAVLIPAPYWVSYPAAATLVGAQARIVPTRAQDGFKLGPEDLERALFPSCKLVVLNSPSNPTGAVYSRDELEQLGAVLTRHSCFILTDEIYEELVYDGAEHHSLVEVCPHLKNRTVVVNGFSKSYAMTGWRVGYAAGPRDVIAAMDRVQNHSTSNACSISQEAALGALTGGTKERMVMRAHFAERRRIVLEGLKSIEGLVLPPPMGAFYAFPDVSSYYAKGLEGSVAMCERILEEVSVALVPGEAFGDDRCIRLSFATGNRLLEEAIARLRRFFQNKIPRTR